MSELRRITERYRLDKLVAASDASSVFRGTDIQSSETVAVKLLNTDGAESEEQRERFLEVCRGLQALQHPSVPKVLDFGFTTAGSAFLVTEYVPGSSFEDFANSSPTRVISLLLFVVDGLEAMAQQGIPSRNLRAANLLVAAGAGGEQVKILGLGSPLLRSEAVPAGPDAYREDLRGFGALSCRMLGISARPEDSRVDIPLEIAAELEDFEALRDLLEASLQGDPEGRFSSWAEVRRALRLSLFGQTGRKRGGMTAALTPASGTQRAAWAGPAAAPAVAAPPAPAAAPPAAFRASGAGAGTMILKNPLAPQASAASVAPARQDEDFGNETLPGLAARPVLPVPAVLPEMPEPLSESRVGGTMRIEMPRLPAPPPPPVQPVAKLPPTVELPVVKVPARDEGDETRPGVDFFEPLVPPAPTAVEPPPPPSLPPIVSPPPVAPPPPVPTPLPVAAVPAPPPIPAPATAPAPARPRPRQGGKGKGLWIGAGAAAAVLLVGGGLFFWLGSRPTPAPPPATPKPVQKTVAPPPVAVQPTPTPAPVHPQIEQAEIAIGAGDLKAAKVALDAISPEDQAAFRPDELERYQQLLGMLAPLKRDEVAATLGRALESGDLRLLRSAANSIPAAEVASLTPEVQKNLARARRALDADGKLARAQKAGNHLDVIRLAAVLMQELPRATRAGEQRERAASALEREADEAIEAGRYDDAAGRLEGLRQVWPDRGGLAGRIERIASERKSDQEMESLLIAVGRSEKANKPVEGLQMLADVRPNRRYADRVQEMRQRLEAQFAQMDRQPPALAVRGAEPQYEKGKAATIPLKITDDYSVKSADGWARAEGGEYAKVSVRHLSGTDWAIDVPADLHQNETIEYYATATDPSGHTGQLGSAERPLKVKRKGFLKSIFGKKDGG
jgi:hypothetical protein